jgi:hypothetical protein
MNSPTATERSDASLRRECRIAGILVLLTILAGLFAEGFVTQRLLTDDATTTAANILAHRDLWQLAFAVYVVEMACQVAGTALFYDLLKPAGRNASLIAAWISVVGIAIKICARVFFIAPLFVLGGAPAFSALGANELRAISMLFLQLNDTGAGLALAFFGFATVLRGVLMFRSTFFPRGLGALGILAGLLWTTFLYRPLGNRMFAVTAAFGLIASLALIGWLLIKGVDGPRWRESARQARP